MSNKCPHCILQSNLSDFQPRVVLFGKFIRKSDLTIQQRYLCKVCNKSFSSASFDPCYHQKKRYLNSIIYRSLVSGLSQRRLAYILKINRKTVIRKFLFLGEKAQESIQKELLKYPPSKEVEFDDLETFEHSKLKPLSVITMVETKSRRILGFKVAQMPAKGHLAYRAKMKYGYRKDERSQARRELFKELQHFIDEQALIKSDESPHYPTDVKCYFPKAKHWTFRGKRGCVTGQGELKGKGFDPLFSLNHTYAMFRASINRLFRRTWNTTKKPERLALHIAMYVKYHNEFLIRNPAR